MNLQEIMGCFVSAATLLPIILIFALRLYGLRSFLALSIYYIFGFVDTMMAEHFIVVSKDFHRIFSVTYNLLDVPLLLIFLTYFSPSPFLSRQMRYIIGAFIVFEFLIIYIMGYNRDALTIIIGPGLSIILFFCAWFFIRQIRFTITQGKSVGKALLISSFLFVYGCYSFIYIMYYIIRTPDITDVYIMYLISSILSIIVVSAGIIVENKRIQKLKELLVTRQELHLIYNK